MNSQEHNEKEKSICQCKILNIISSDKDLTTNLVVDDERVKEITPNNSNLNNTSNINFNITEQVHTETSPQLQMSSPVATNTNSVPVTETVNASTETNAGPSNNTAIVQTTAVSNSTPNTQQCANVVTIPVPIVQNEDNYTYITVKGSLHDHSCAVFGLDDEEIQALSKRFENGVKSVVNGIMVSVPPMQMVNTMAQLSYKVICSCGEAEICWTMQREV